jgi:HAD superfamily hydrolase (TIGR01509 family)
VTSGEEMHPGTLVPARFAAVIFDLDGVLLDTERICALAEARLCREHGFEYGPADQAATLGLDPLEASRHYARRFELSVSEAPRLEAEFERMLREEIERDTSPMPGAVDLVARLASRVRLGVASNSRRAVVELAMERAGMTSKFDAIVSVDDVAEPKPAPDPYRKACARLGVAPHQALALEDTAVGARSALAAGLECYAVTTADLSPGIHVGHRVRSLAELLTGRTGARPAGDAVTKDGFTSAARPS